MRLSLRSILLTPLLIVSLAASAPRAAVAKQRR